MGGEAREGAATYLERILCCGGKRMEMVRVEPVGDPNIGRRGCLIAFGIAKGSLGPIRKGRSPPCTHV
jgi:hypothetical protein